MVKCAIDYIYCVFKLLSALYPLEKIQLAPNRYYPPWLPPVAYSPWNGLRAYDDIAVMNLSWPLQPIPDKYQVASQTSPLGLSLSPCPPLFPHSLSLSCLYLFFSFLQLYCSMGKSGYFPREKPPATESRYPAYGACWRFTVSIVDGNLAWITGSLTCV